MITLTFVTQKQDIPAIIRLAYGQIGEMMLQAAWQQRLRCRRNLLRIYYSLATVFFLIALLALHCGYRSGNITLPSSRDVFALSLFFFCSFAALPLLVPLLLRMLIRAVTGQHSNDERYAAFIEKCRKYAVTQLEKSGPGHYMYYVDQDSIRWFVSGKEEKKEMPWRNYLCSTEDDNWLIFYHRNKRQFCFFAIPKSSSLVEEEAYQTSLAQLRALRPDEPMVSENT